MRDEVISQLKGDIEVVRDQYREAMDRLAQRDDTVSQCNMEMNRLKAKLQETNAVVRPVSLQYTYILTMCSTPCATKLAR